MTCIHSPSATELRTCIHSLSATELCTCIHSPSATELSTCIHSLSVISLSTCIHSPSAIELCTCIHSLSATELSTCIHSPSAISLGTRIPSSSAIYLYFKAWRLWGHLLPSLIFRVRNKSFFEADDIEFQCRRVNGRKQFVCVKHSFLYYDEHGMEPRTDLCSERRTSVGNLLVSSSLVHGVLNKFSYQLYVSELPATRVSTKRTWPYVKYMHSFRI
jgi:hypothetical protein